MDKKIVILIIFLSILFTFFYFIIRCIIQRRRRLQREREALAFLYATTDVILDEFRPQSPNALDPTVLASLPNSNYKKPTLPNENSSQTCSICLCEVDEGEMVRVLPNCKHLFHVGCIDMWLHSHSTCPLCRAPVPPKEAIVIIEKGENSDVANVRPTVVENTSSEPNGRRLSSSSESSFTLEDLELMLAMEEQLGLELAERR